MANFALKFADSPNQYTFENVQSFRDTFADAVTATSRLPGLSGGFDHYGSEDAPTAVGQVNVSFVVFAEDQDDMQAKIDAVRKLKYLGKQKIYWQPQGSANERWCYGRIGNISVAKRPANMTDWVQSITVSFQVADPFWYEDEDSQVINASGTSTQDTITNTGNAVALARLVIEATSGHTATDPIVKRIVSAAAADQVGWTGTLTYGESLEIDAQAKSVELDAVASYSNFTFDHPDWFRLLPGSNTIQVEFDNAGDEADVTVYWYPTNI